MPLYKNWLTLKIWVRKDWRTSEWLVSPRQYGYPMTSRFPSFEAAIARADEIAEERRAGRRAAAKGEAA